MDKSKITEDNKSKSNGGDKSTVENSVDKKKYEQSSKKVYLRHRSNASAEYKFFGNYERFEAHERKEFPESILKDKNYQKASKYFNVEIPKEGGK